MISFNNEKQITEWLILAENHFIELKALVECEKNACKMVEKTTKGLLYRREINSRVKRVNDCLSAANRYIQDNS